MDGCDVGQHPLVTRLQKGAFHQRPPQPRYTHTWNVGVVTKHIRSKGENATLPLQELTHKLAMLLALTRPSRSADLVSLDLNLRSYSLDGVTFLPSSLLNQGGRNMEQSFSFPVILRMSCCAQ